MKCYPARKKFMVPSLRFHNQTASLILAFYRMFPRNRKGGYKCYNKPREAFIGGNVQKTRDGSGRENT